ncbi:MAG: hypothetical protein V5A62_00535 [Haloarculaceae archaeon]
MTDEVFTEPDDTTDGWVDVRMSEPDQGEWDIDAVVVGGRVEYVDLRIRPALLASFIECLVDDVGDERGAEILAEVADRQGVDLGEHSTDG